jgi:hypothetical protein
MPNGFWIELPSHDPLNGMMSRMRACYYQQESAWKGQKPQDYRDSGQTQTAKGEETMCTFEPSAALKVSNDLVSEAMLPVLHGERLLRKTSVKKRGAEDPLHHLGIRPCGAREDVH